MKPTDGEVGILRNKDKDEGGEGKVCGKRGGRCTQRIKVKEIRFFKKKLGKKVSSVSSKFFN